LQGRNREGVRPRGDKEVVEGHGGIFFLLLSCYQFEVEGKNIRVGLTSIEGLALKTAEKVIEERKNGEYLYN